MDHPTELPCSNCGAALNFEPGTHALVCPNCGAENEIPEIEAGPWGAPNGAEIRELDYAAALANRLDDTGVETSASVRCPGCGAEVTLDDSTLAEACPFCATPLNRSAEHEHRHPKPGAVLPFLLKEREAREAMKKWLGSLWFAPNSLKKYAEAGRPMQGVYLPHYTYDADGQAWYQGMRGDAYYVTRTRVVMVDGDEQTQTYQERRIRWSPRSGHVRRFFDDVLVPATANEGSSKAEAGGTSWDLAALEPFRTQYLAGFRAEMPLIGLEEGFSTAERTMEAMLRRDVRFDIGGDEQKILSMQTQYDRITFKHVLLPVWLAAYRWRNKPFRVTINGRTGAVSGERPYSVWKIALAVIAGLILAGVIGYLIALEQGVSF